MARPEAVGRASFSAAAPDCARGPLVIGCRRYSASSNNSAALAAVADRRTDIGFSCGQVLRIAVNTSSGKRRRLASAPPYSSVRRFVNGEMNADAVWSYPEPSESAAELKGRVAFWKGVQVID